MISRRRYKSIALIRSIWMAAGVVVIAAILAIGLAAAWLKPPMGELAQLFLYLLISGSISAVLGIGWLVYGSQNVRLRLQLTLTYLVGALIVLVNITVTASLMFLSVHDFSVLVLLMVFSTAISLFFAFYISSQLTRQVRLLVQGANALAAGKLDTKVIGGGSQELTALSNAFNHMAAQLHASAQARQEMEQSRKELVAAIGHDLRTPLASLRLMIEAINDGVTDSAQTKLFMERMQTEVIYMARLIEDLFELSQYDAGALRLHPEMGQLSDLISDTLEGMRTHAEARQQKLVGKIEGELPALKYDAHKIQRVLNNLVSNAVQHSPPDGTITITAQHSGEWVEVSVCDSGEGVSDKDKDLIFNPFYRGEPSRKRISGGAGLGLAIAKAIVEAHHGTIELAAAPAGSGACFVFKLPITLK